MNKDANKNALFMLKSSIFAAPTICKNVLLNCSFARLVVQVVRAPAACCFCCKPLAEFHARSSQHLYTRPAVMLRTGLLNVRAVRENPAFAALPPSN